MLGIVLIVMFYTTFVSFAGLLFGLATANDDLVNTTSLICIVCMAGTVLLRIWG